MHSQLRICPLCNSFMNSGLKVVRCIECGEVFKLDERNNVWRNPNIMDVSYFDPESSVLSILFPHKFSIDTIYGKKTFNSMAAFLLTLTWPGSPDIGIYDELASLSGMDAYRARNLLPDWKDLQAIYWDRRIISRNSSGYQRLLIKAFDELFMQSHLFRLGLMKSRGKVFMCTNGERDPKRTLITRNEFLSLIERERNKISFQNEDSL